MSNDSTCTITCVSAPSGGGKTTIVRQLAQLIPNSVALYFDEYDDLDEGANIHPEDLYQWYLDGGDFNAWQMPRLANDLELLRRGRPIQSVSDDKVLAHQPFIFLDAAMGRANSALQPYIDLMIYIDTPLDVAMARRIQRDYFGRQHVDAQKTLAQIGGMTAAYLDWARGAYMEMDRQVKSLSDFVLDGSLPVDDLVQKIIVTMELKELDINQWCNQGDPPNLSPFYD